MQSNLLPVSKEGVKYIASTLGILIVFILLDLEFLALFSFLLLIAFTYMFRNPERQLPNFQENSVISSCDGIVRSITEINDSQYAYRVDVESSCLDVAILRVPSNSSVESIETHYGTRVSKGSKLFSALNENTQIVFKDTRGNVYKVKHTLKQSFAPLYIDIIKAQKLHQTARYGVMINGVTSIYLPHNFRINVSVGNELKAAETLIGYFS